MAEYMKRICKKHGLYIHRQSPSRTSWRCKQCSMDAVNKRRRKIKTKLIADFGGKCIRCGFNDSNAALCFHHRDPEQKDFGLARYSKAYHKMLEEAKKCDLLCLNCHAIIHDEEYLQNQ